MFYKNFIDLCLKAGKSPSFVVTQVGLNKSAVTSWKRGTNPTNSTAVKIANYFGISVEELMGKEKTAPADVPDLGTFSTAALDVASAYDAATPELQAAVRRVLGLM